MAFFPDKAVVKSLPGEPNLVISLQLAGKLRNLDRPKEELLEKPLQRIQKSAAPPAPRQQRKGKGVAAVAAAPLAPAPPPQEPAVALHAGPAPDSPTLNPSATTNEEAWRQGRLLRVGQQCFWVEVNPPWIERLEVPGAPFAGVPLCPLLTAHFHEEAACQWRWSRQVQRGSSGAGDSHNAAAEEWEAIEGATSRLFTPTEADVGCRLRVECTPGRRDRDAVGAEPGSGDLHLGEPATAACGPVRPLPSPLGAAARLALTRQRAAAPEFRVVTYNLLADCYASTEVARTQLFTHVDPQFMAPEYRRPLATAELLGFQGDIVCLQEVDEKMFERFLQPQLGAAGYQGFYTNKAGSAREGCALFFRTDRFALVAQRALTLRDFFPPAPGAPAKHAAPFEPMLRTSPFLLRTLQRVLTVAQLALLAPVNDPQGRCRPLCVANTHLFFHNQAPHVRTMHAWAIVQEAYELMQHALADPELSAALGGHAPSLLFCGDLNSSLNIGVPGVIELLRSGQLPADWWDWQRGVGFNWAKGMAEEGEGEEGEGSSSSGPEPNGASAEALGEDAAAAGEAVAGVDLSLPCKLSSADGLRTPCTHYLPYFQGLLDYVWHDPRAAELAREVPPPTIEQLNQGLGGYLPSAHFPSDHLPLVFDLRFRQG